MGVTALPYLSLVIPTRNDDYPSNVLAVQNKSLVILQRQLEDAKIESEILVIEYNPDPSRPPLGESLRVEQGRYVTIKVLRVDPRYHRRFRYSDRRAFHQTCAVNAGLRRSRGKFFVYRAADHIYSGELVQFLARRCLRDDTIYRCDRVDIDQAAFAPAFSARLDQISAICERHNVRRYEPLSREPSWRIPHLHTQACGDFLLMSRELWMRVAGLREGRAPIFLDSDSLAFHAAYSVNRREAILDRDCCVYKLRHERRTETRIRQSWKPYVLKLDARLRRTSRLADISRAIFAISKRLDDSIQGIALDSFERHFLLPAYLWGRGFPVIRQNLRGWGLPGETLPETILARAAWERCV